MTVDSGSRNTSFVTAKQGTDCTNASEHYQPIPIQTISALDEDADLSDSQAELEDMYGDEGEENAQDEDGESFVIRNRNEFDYNCGKPEVNSNGQTPRAENYCEIIPRNMIMTNITKIEEAALAHEASFDQDEIIRIKK